MVVYLSTKIDLSTAEALSRITSGWLGSQDIGNCCKMSWRDYCSLHYFLPVKKSDRVDLVAEPSISIDAEYCSS